MAQYTGRDLAAGAVSMVGAHDFDFRPEGVSPRRLPAWTRAQLPTVMDPIVRMPSGVRLVFITDSSRIALSAQTTRLVTPPAEPRPAAFDLVVDGRSPRTWQSTLGNTIWLDRSNPESFRLERGPAHTVVWENLGSGRKQCELWLPHNAFVELRGLELDAGSLLVPVPEPTARRWAHYGSSISHCLEAESPTGIWPAVTASALGLHLVNYGFGGQCHLDQFMARTLRDTPADLISLKVGINVINGDTMRERVFVPAVHGFLDTLREGQRDTPVVLISPIFCPSAETTPGPTLPGADGRFRTEPGHARLRQGCLTLERVRELLAQIVAERRAAGDGGLYYVDGLELFGAADAGDLPDDLHPNPAGYRRMGERFAEILARLGLVTA